MLLVIDGILAIKVPHLSNIFQMNVTRKTSYKYISLIESAQAKLLVYLCMCLCISVFPTCSVMKALLLSLALLSVFQEKP